MRFGDLSNQAAPKEMIIFEGIIGVLHQDDIAEYEKLDAERKKDWKKILGLFRINKSVVDNINYVTWNKDTQMTVVSFFPEDAKYALDAVITSNNIGAGLEMWNMNDLNHELSRRPDIVRIFVSTPDMSLTFGSKSYVVRTPSDIRRDV
jgi:hypothetical protein